MIPFAVRLILIVLAVCIGAAQSEARTGSSDATNLGAYIAALDTLQSDLAAASFDEVQAILLRMPSRWLVRHGVQEFSVPTAWIRESLRRAEGSEWVAARDRVTARLGRMRREASVLAGNKPLENPADAHETLARVLAQPEFQRSGASLWAEGLGDRISRWFTDLWTRIGGPRLESRSRALLFAWLAGLAALGALTWWLVRALAASPRGPSVSFRAAGSRRRSARSWARAALGAYQAGDVREVARCAYHAAVARLEDEGAWRRDDARTPREYLRLLPPAHERRPMLAEIAGRFERAWYGSDSGTPEQGRALLVRLKELGCLPSDQPI